MSPVLIVLLPTSFKLPDLLAVFFLLCSDYYFPEVGIYAKKKVRKKERRKERKNKERKGGRRKK